MMTREQVLEMLAILSAEFKVVRPKLRWQRNTRSGCYRPGKRLICMGPLSRSDIGEGGAEFTALHEFAHHLDHVRNDVPKRIRRTWARTFEIKKGVRTGSHDAPFRFALLKVVTAWYGSADAYRWDKEYKAVKKWWEERQPKK